MGMFLNSIEPYDKYKTITKGLYFVDKTELLEELIPALISLSSSIEQTRLQRQSFFPLCQKTDSCILS